MMESRLLDPTAERSPVERPPLPKSDNLSGKTVALLDISKPRGDVFLDRIETLLQNQGAEVIRYRKPTFTRPAPTDLLQRIATECDLVIEALAD